MSIANRRTRAAILLLSLALAVSGCTNLRAVNRWASSSLQVSRFDGVVDTYATMPERVAVYDPDNASFWQQQATTRKAQAQALEELIGVVADYMAALEAMSANGVASYSKEIGAVTRSLQKTGVVSGDTVGAAGQLTATVANAATELWQKRKVRQLIEDANAPLQAILAGELRSIVEQDFKRNLEQEAALVDGHFKQLLRHGGGSAAAKAALEEWRRLRLGEIEGRQQARLAYLKILDRIARGHEALYEGRKDLGAKDLVQELYVLSNQIRKDANALVRVRG